MDEHELVRGVFLEKMLFTATAKVEILRRLETAPPYELDKIYSSLHQVRKVRRRLIALYRAYLKRGRNWNDPEPA